MTDEASVTFWIDRLKAGDPAAAGPLWQRYFSRLVRLARRRLRQARPAAAAEEDVALSAFENFCRATAQGRYPQMLDRDDLWRLLVAITDRKAIDLVRHDRRARRGGGRVLAEAALVPGTPAGEAGLAAVPCPRPTPAFAALLADEYRRLIGLLGDDRLREVARLKLEGHANDEIARRLDCGLRTVERKLTLIRSRWQREVQP
jgi:DNA-directed RNA polymerase specialized sigma24 family protein